MSYSCFFCRKNKTSCVWAYFIPGIFQYLFARYEAYPKIITFYSHAKDRGMSRLSRFLNVFADNIIFHIFKFAGADETSGEYIYIKFLWDQIKHQKRTKSLHLQGNIWEAHAVLQKFLYRGIYLWKKRITSLWNQPYPDMRAISGVIEPNICILIKISKRPPRRHLRSRSVGITREPRGGHVMYIVACSGRCDAFITCGSENYISWETWLSQVLPFTVLLYSFCPPALLALCPQTVCKLKVSLS